MARNSFIIIGVVAFLLAVVSASESAALRVTDVRYWSAPDHTRIVVDSDQPIAYQNFELTDPARLVVDLQGALSSLTTQKLEVGDSIVHRIRVGQLNRETVRLVIDLVTQTESSIFTLNKYLDKPYRLVIDLLRADLAEKEKESRLQQRSKTRKIIVIDPGHGGDDTGAIGARGIYEKDVVLSLATSLKNAINQREGFKAFVTREGDYFVPLRKRVEIAREYGAHLFVSVHTDANFNKKVRGASVYCLSTKGASDEAAKLLAERENASDFIGGVSYASNKDLDSILIDLVQTQTINDSLRLGGMVLTALGNFNEVKFKQPKQAGFAVLKATEIPSILIETGFITNPTDAKLLKSKSFQLSLAQAIAQESFSFTEMLTKRDAMTVQAPPSPREKGEVHLVKPNETLWQIAQQYNTTVDELIKLNNLKRADDIKAGKALVVP